MLLWTDWLAIAILVSVSMFLFGLTKYHTAGIVVCFNKI